MLPNFSKPQDEAIDYALEMGGCNIFCRPGFGKTLTGLEVIASGTGRTLVVAPLLVASSVWPAENAKWGYDLNYKFLHGKNKNFDNLPELCLINYEGLKWLHDEILKHGNPFTHIIYDEITKLKRPGTRRFRNWRHIAPQFDTRIGLTGSPVGNKLHDVWGPQYLVDLGESLHDTFTMFQGRWFFKTKEHQLEPLTGAAPQIFTEMKKSARAWSNDHIAMPELIHTMIPIELPQAARAWYDELKEESTIEDIDFVADNKGVVHGKHRQIAGGGMKDRDGRVIQLHTAKIEALDKLLEEIDPEPVLIVFEYRHDFAAIFATLTKRYGNRFGFIHGDTTDSQDIATLARWNAGELGAFAFHPLACSYGLNLQDVGRHIIYYTVPSSLELVQQSTARLWRQGQKHSVHAYYLCVEDTVDVTTLEMVDKKEDIQDLCFDMLTR